MALSEPSVARYSNPIARYVAATRPPFLIASFLPVLIGLAAVRHTGTGILPVAAWLTMLGAVLLHAGANVLNDYYDALNGTDQVNSGRLFPFTGGSRFIQNGVLTTGETQGFGFALLAAAALIGLALLPHAGLPLVGLGLAALFICWAYSAPPFALNSRGLGELSVGVGFGLLIPLGAFLIQCGYLDRLVLWAALPYALLVTALLYVNQFPDREADAAVGKAHWVVRLGPRGARWGYLLLVSGAYLFLLVAAGFGPLPALALLGLLSLPPSMVAAALVIRHAETPQRLAPAIRLTIAVLPIHALAISAGMVFG